MGRSDEYLAKMGIEVWLPRWQPEGAVKADMPSQQAVGSLSLTPVTDRVEPVCPSGLPDWQQLKAEVSQCT
ncbi:MAG: hypothetical protein ACK443_07430, partial [Methylococcaceae bacterium]